MSTEKISEAVLRLHAEVNRLERRIAEHEQFRHQHRDCDKMGVELQKLRAFAQDIMDEWPDVGMLDGFDLQELAVKHGLLAETTRHMPCAEEGCNCAEMCDERDWQDGVQCYRVTALLKPPQMV